MKRYLYCSLLSDRKLTIICGIISYRGYPSAEVQSAYSTDSPNKTFVGLLIEWLECSQMVRETEVQSDIVITKTQQMVLDASLLNTQDYNIGTKSKWSFLGKCITSSPAPRCCS